VLARAAADTARLELASMSWLDVDFEDDDDVAIVVLESKLNFAAGGKIAVRFDGMCRSK
jgi:hypothetical protein